MKYLTLRVAALALMSLFATQAQALAITAPTTDACLLDPTCWTDSTGNPSQPTASEIEALVGSSSSLDDVYKAEAPGATGGTVIEEGIFTSSYLTSFNWVETDTDGPSGASIYYVGGDVIDCTLCYLSVKDGRNNPNLYVFNLSNIWDGKETIDLSGFWLDTQGGISNIAIWTPSASVPEPAGLGLLGLGLILLAVKRRQT